MTMKSASLRALAFILMLAGGNLVFWLFVWAFAFSFKRLKLSFFRNPILYLGILIFAGGIFLLSLAVKRQE